MKQRKHLPAILLVFAMIAALLAGCGSDAPAPSAVESLGQESPAPTPIVSDEPFTEGNLLPMYLQIAQQEYGYPRVLDEQRVDLDGDNAEETVTLLRDWAPIFNEAGEPSYENDLFHYPLIRVEKDGQVYEHRWEMVSYGSAMYCMEDTEGRSFIVVTLSTGGTGAGTMEVAAFALEGSGLVRLPVPTYQSEGLNQCGFEAVAAYRDGFQMEVSVPSTGFSQSLPLGEYPTYEEWELSPYDGEGNCLFDRQGGVDPISAATVEERDGGQVLRLHQYVYGVSAHGEYLGYIISDIVWDGDGYVVLEQRVVQ